MPNLNHVQVQDSLSMLVEANLVLLKFSKLQIGQVMPNLNHIQVQDSLSMIVEANLVLLKFAKLQIALGSYIEVTNSYFCFKNGRTFRGGSLKHLKRKHNNYCDHVKGLKFTNTLPQTGQKKACSFWNGSLSKLSKPYLL